MSFDCMTFLCHDVIIKILFKNILLFLFLFEVIYIVKSHALEYINMLILLKIILITIINTNFAMFIKSI